MSAGPTRRDLLGGGLRAGGLGLAASAAPALAGAGQALAQLTGDASILRRLVRLEQEAAFAYDRGAKSDSLPPPLRDTLKLLREQDLAHAEKLTAALQALGERRPALPRSVDDVDGLARALAGGERDFLSFALDLEERTVRAYYQALQRLGDAKTIKFAATIMGSDGQHLVVLRRALHRDPVPEALETGSA